ncbi:MAG: tripartite tricarboxylate transporter TctB family protein [Alphaproteobacteria bacterium]|nr:tripartite tricarboxylate transporter TctB family protein [Alphaproteobacteria bacterium]
MRDWLNPNAITGALYLILGLFVVFVLIPIGVDEPSNVEFAVLAPSYWPRIICLVLAALGLGMLVRTWLSLRSGVPEETDEENKISEMVFWRAGLVIAGSFVLYAVLETLGFVLAGTIALALLMLLAGERRPLHVGLISVGIPLLLYLFFTKAASIPIPAGILEPILV